MAVLNRRAATDVLVLVCVAGALRIPALFTDFWLDEIWSYEEFALRARSVVDIFVGPGFRHDNNHHLNTIFMYFLRDHPGWVVYRLPALVAGLLTVAVATSAGNLRGRPEGVFSGLLVAGSFIMIVYSTEARGYALVLLFAALGYVALHRFLDEPNWPAAIAFWATVSLGLTAHVTILHFYLGALVWSIYRLRPSPWEMLRLHGVPCLFGALWALVVLAGFRAAGGPGWTWRQMVDESLGWTFSYPLSTVPPLLAAAAAAAVVLWDARALIREGSDQALFHLPVIAGPALLVAAVSPPFLAPRYFLISLFFLLLVVARSLAVLWRQPGLRRMLAAGFMMIVVAGNLMYLPRFWREGRGGASRAVPYVIANTASFDVRVGSVPVDRWASLPIRFYERKLGLRDRIRYVPQQSGDRGQRVELDWMIVQTLNSPRNGTNADAARVPKFVGLPSGANAILRAEYPCYGPSGMNWYVYQRDATGAGPPPFTR